MRLRTTSSIVRLSLWFLAIFVFAAIFLHGGYLSLRRLQRTVQELGQVCVGMMELGLGGVTTSDRAAWLKK